MQSILSWRVLILGVLSWLVPFVFAFLFFGSDGQLRIPEPLFKSMMVVVFGALGLWLMLRAFKHVSPTAQTGLALGVLWLAINLVLDFAVLLPLSGMSLPGYMADIGLRYLLMPVMGLALGMMADSVRGK